MKTILKILFLQESENFGGEKKNSKVSNISRTYVYIAYLTVNIVKGKFVSKEANKQSYPLSKIASIGFWNN